MIVRKIDGFTMFLDPDDSGISKRMIKTNGNREPAFQWILKQEATGIAYDVGANLGQYTLRLAKLCKMVIAFEPDERSAKLLTKNIYANKLRNVIQLSHPISNVNKIIKFEQTPKPNLSRISEDGTIEHKARSIDNLIVAGLYRPNFIKMDIEGGEVNALKGAMKTLKDAKKMKLLIEVHPKFYSKDNDFRTVLEDLLAFGYYFKYVVNAKWKMDKFKNYECVKRSKSYKHRAVFKGVPANKVLKWATEMPADGIKVIRSILMVKK